MTIICLFLLIIASVAFLWSLYDESNVKLGLGVFEREQGGAGLVTDIVGVMPYIRKGVEK